MNLIVKIAWRNILRHKGKSIIIGVILFLGAFLMTIGNGIISGMDAGLQKNIVNSFTGDIVLVSQKQESDNVFIEFMGKAVEPINNYVDIREFLKTQNSYVKDFIPIGKNMVMVLNEDGMPAYSFVIGADIEKYKKMFPDNMVPIEGRLINKDEKGILIATGARQEMFNTTGIWFKPEKETLNTVNFPKEIHVNRDMITTKDSVVLMGFNNDNTSSDIRVGIKGIVKYKALNTILGNFPLMDIESYRTCLGYFSAQEKAVDVSAENKVLFNSEEENLDALFSDNFQTDTNSNFSATSTENGLNDIPASEQIDQKVDIDAGAYNLVLVRLKNGENLKKSVSELNKFFKEKNLGVRAITWKKAMGTIGSMAVLIKTALFMFVMFLFFVAIIIIVNTLSMAAIERTSELGMMRAIGAQKKFIRKMFFGETAILSFFFGGAGIMAGIIVLKIITALKFTTTNDMIQLLYGGDTFHPLLAFYDIVLAIVQLTLVTVIAVIYPIIVASSIKPLDAISRD